MTTKVTITNHGPSLVLVKHMNRHRTSGTTEQFPERVAVLESKYRGPPLLPGHSEEFYVHRDQELHVVELEVNGFDVAVPSR